MRVWLFLLVAAVSFIWLYTACQPTSAPPLSSAVSPAEMDERLSTWLQEFKRPKDQQSFQYDLDSQGRIGMLVEVQPDASLPQVNGVLFHSKAGNIVGARSTASGLQELRKHPSILRMEASVRQHPHRVFSNAESLAHTTAFAKAPDTHTYRLQLSQRPQTKPGTIIVRVYGAYHSSSRKSECAPLLKVCLDQACNSLIDSDIVIYNHKLPSGVKDKYPKPYSFARVAVDIEPNGIREVFLQVSTHVRAGSGRYNLVVSSHEFGFSTQDLTGGTITSTKKPFLIGNGTSRYRETTKLTGKNTIVGIVDTGIDWCHPDFIDKNGQSRILALWDQTLKPIPGDASHDVGFDNNPSNDYGVLYNQQQITAALKNCDKKKIRSLDTNGHGTHVAGIAAASGTRPGMAPGANLVIVKYTFYSSKQPDALNFILNQGKIHNMPVVINMSLGTSAGPKDGSSLSERTVTQLVGMGKNIVVSAGNSGASAIHAQGTATLNKKESIQFSLYRSSRYKGMVMSMYTHPNDVYEMALKSPKGKIYKGVWRQNKTWTDGIARITLSPGRTTYSTFRVTSFGVSHSKVTPATETWTLEITKKSGNGNGKFDAYVSSTRSNVRFRTHALRNANGSYKGTVGAPGSSPGSLTVASYSVQYIFDRSNNKYGYSSSYKEMGQLASSSSRGPVGDGRPGVDIGAPGQYIESSESAHRRKDSTTLLNPLYRAISGTSMSAPMVAGVAALLLEQDPELFVRPLLKTFARVPDCCKPLDTNQWGAGMMQLHGIYEAINTKSKPTVTLYVEENKSVWKVGEVVPLKIRSSDKLVEYHWDTNNDGLNEHIKLQPNLSYKLTKVGTKVINLVAYNEYGKGTKTTIRLNVAAAQGAEPKAEPKAEPSTGQEAVVPKEHSPEPSTEPTTEKSVEVSSPEPGLEASTEPTQEQVGPEPKTEPTTQPNEPVSSTEPAPGEKPQTATPDKDQTPTTNQPDITMTSHKDCGCSSNNNPSAPPLPTFLLGLVGLFFLRLTRNKAQRLS